MAVVKSEALQWVESARTLSKLQRQEMPQYAELFQMVDDALDRIEADVRDHWPLTPEEKKKVNIGLYAVRELEEQAEDLTVALVHLDANLVKGI